MASMPITEEGSINVDRSPLLQLHPRADGIANVDRSPARFTPLEWSIVALAEGDSLASLREPSRLTKAMEVLFGIRLHNRFANDRSETLRRVAVWAWRRDGNVPQSEIEGFLAAGFTPEQLALLQASIEKSRKGAKARRRNW